VFFALWKPARVHLRRPGPYIALAINALCTLPVIIWNAQHHWITVAHVANDAGLSDPWRFRISAPLDFLAGTFGLLHPIFFLATAWAAIAMWKRYPHDPLLRFFFSMGGPLFLAYALFTFYSPAQLNWIAASVVPLFCVMVAFWEKRYSEGTRGIRAVLTMAIITGGAALALLHETDLAKKVVGQYLPSHADPLRRVRGWSDMARIVERERTALEAEGKPVFIIGGHYGTTGLLSFYIPEASASASTTPLVYYRSTARPNNQFYFWKGYAGERRGQNAIYVQEKDKPSPVPANVIEEFASVTAIGSFPVMRNGRVLHQVHLFACRDLQR
jgi:hypothetical protein